MQRRWQRRGTHHAGAASRFEESHFIVPADFVFDADSPIELYQVCADAKEHVLAVVDDLAGAGMLVGRSAAAEIGAALEERYAKAGVRERAGCR